MNIQSIIYLAIGILFSIVSITLLHSQSIEHNSLLINIQTNLSIVIAVGSLYTSLQQIKEYKIEKFNK